MYWRDVPNISCDAWARAVDSDVPSTRVGSNRVAILCAESDPGRCHRRLLSDVLSARGRPVVHLLGDGRLVDHTLSPDAVVEGDRVHYPGQPRLEI